MFLNFTFKHENVIQIYSLFSVSKKRLADFDSERNDHQCLLLVCSWVEINKLIN